MAIGYAQARRRRRRGVPGWTLALALTVAAGTPAPLRAEAPTWMHWRAPDGCPSAAEMHSRIAQLPGPAPRDLVLDAEVTRRPEGGLRLRVRGTRAGQPLAPRTLEASECAPLADATVLLASLALEATPEPAVTPEASEGGDALMPPLPSVPRVPAARRPPWTLRAGAHLEAGLLPAATLGLTFGLERRVATSGYFALRGAFSPRETPGPERVLENGAGREVRARALLRYGVLRLAAGWAPRLGDGRFGLRVGGLLEGGLVRVRAEGEGLVALGALRRGVGALGVVLGASWWPGGPPARLGIGVSGDLRVPFDRLRFVVDGAGPEGTAAEIGRLGALGGALVLELRVRLGSGQGSTSS